MPRTCIGCGAWCRKADGRFSCADCRQRYAFIEPPLCEVCGRPFEGLVANRAVCTGCRAHPPPIGQSRALLHYRGSGLRLVHALKYENGSYLRAEIAALLAEHKRWNAYFEDALLVPVPLHAARERARGYNQASVIAQAAGEVFSSVRIAPLLARVRATPSQTNLSKEARQANMKDAFACTGPVPGSARVIIVDDVHTSGATLTACARTLGLPRRQLAAFTLAHG